MSTHDEEALQWAGDNDERLSASSSSQASRRRGGASGISDEGIVASPQASVNTDGGEGDEDGGGVERAGLSSFALLAFGVLGGIYLLFSVAWLITVLRNPEQFEDPLGNVMFVSGLWMALAAPAAWFGAVLYLGRAKAAWVRLLFLLIGVAIMIPWPFIVWAG